MTEKKLAQYFDYLDELREEGVTNMFGATPYLMRDCGLSKDKASEVLSLWMCSYDNDKTTAERARAALAGGGE